MANTTLTLDPGEPYSRPATSLPASKVPPQPGVGVAVTAKPARHQGTPTAGRKTLDVARSTGGGQNRMRSPGVGVVRLRHVADVDIKLGGPPRWIVTRKGTLEQLDAGQIPPAGSIPAPPLSALRGSFLHNVGHDLRAAIQDVEHHPDHAALAFALAALGPEATALYFGALATGASAVAGVQAAKHGRRTDAAIDFLAAAPGVASLLLRLRALGLSADAAEKSRILDRIAEEAHHGQLDSPTLADSERAAVKNAADSRRRLGNSAAKRVRIAKKADVASAGLSAVGVDSSVVPGLVPPPWARQDDRRP